MIRWILLGLLLCAPPVRAQVPSPHAIEAPAWFVETFLDLRDDVKEAAGAGKRVMLYFGQDGCPYCRQLLQTNFTQKRIADKTRAGLVPIALNIWGDRPVTWFDGRTRTEKEFAAFLKVQYTPTLLFFDEHGGVVARVNGYYPPHRLEAALDYVVGRLERRQAFDEYMRGAVKEAASAQLADEPFFLRSTDLSRKPGAKPLVVLFETRHCAGCDELHRDGFRRPEVQALVARFDIARLDLADRAGIVAPDGTRTDAGTFAGRLKVLYTPSLVFFDATGAEVFRIEAYLRAFHLAAAMEYVASGAHRSEPSFQRYIQSRAERLRAKGGRVDLWK